jgi:hypothetical protein
MLGVLHTWSRTLIFHPHIHYLVPGGGLSPDGRQWIAARKNFLLPIKALGLRCLSLFKDRLQKDHPDLFAQVPAKVWKRHWNVDSRPAGSGLNALRYLARYVFKTATANQHVQFLPEGKVRWSYRESQTGKRTSLKLEPLDFMGRFLQHVLPRGFARVRTFGWLHPAAKVRLNRVRALLHQQPLLTPAEVQTWHPPAEPLLELPGDRTVEVGSAPQCPCCHQTMRLVGTWHPARRIDFPRRPP